MIGPVELYSAAVEHCFNVLCLSTNHACFKQWLSGQIVQPCCVFLWYVHLFSNSFLFSSFLTYLFHYNTTVVLHYVKQSNKSRSNSNVLFPQSSFHGTKPVTESNNGLTYIKHCNSKAVLDKFFLLSIT